MAAPRLAQLGAASGSGGSSGSSAVAPRKNSVPSAAIPPPRPLPIPGRKASKEAKQSEDQAKLAELLTQCGQGSLLRGWRRELDRLGELEVDFTDFIRVAVNLGYTGDISRLFGSDGDASKLSLTEVAPREGQLMDRVKCWIRDKFGSVRKAFSEFDVDKAGKLDRGQLIEALRRHGFEAGVEELNAIYDCIDYSDDGVELEEILILEVDPKVRSQEIYKEKVGKMSVWKQLAAQEFLEATSMEAKAKKAKPTHRLAPRPWNAKTFEQMPQVSCHKRLMAVKDVFRRQRRARLAFLAHLRKAFGTEVRGLRRALDTDGTYSFSYMTLRRYCNKANLKIDLRDLWGSLDQDGDGVVRLEEMAVKPALALSNFKTWAQGLPILQSCAAIWESPEAAAASRKNTGTWFSEKKMLFSTFQDTLAELGWPEVNNKDVRQSIFTTLDLNGCGVVSRSDLEWLDKWRPAEWLYTEPDPAAWEELKALLVHIYGHPLKAWRSLLDKDDSNIVSWDEFRQACRTVKFLGNAAGAWRVLDADMSCAISLTEYDPESAEILSSFKEWAETNFGSIKHCFRALDMDRSGTLTFAEMKRACHKMRWKGDVRVLFDCLDVDRKKGGEDAKRSISKEEVAFLDTWTVIPSQEELEAEDPPPPKLPKAPCQAVLDVTSRLFSPPPAPVRKSAPHADLSDVVAASDEPSVGAWLPPGQKTPLSRQASDSALHARSAAGFGRRLLAPKATRRSMGGSRCLGGARTKEPEEPEDPILGPWAARWRRAVLANRADQLLEEEFGAGHLEQVK
mmetsp:Transcript_72018/g.154131  ORF Transcript_72018/g.154131 Transcript_72018/m.154131 type:complete len:791 (+) Transcript_72018:91-2463(+)